MHVLTSESNKGFNQSGIHVHAIMSGWAWRDMLSLRSFLRRVRNRRPCVSMHLGLMYDYHPMITFAPTLSKKLFPRVPFVTRYESAFVGANPEKTPLFARALRKYIVQRWAGTEGVAYSSGTLLRDSDYVITLSERHRDMVVEEWPPVSRKMVIIPPPPNIRIVDNRDGVAREQGRRMLGLDAKEVVLAFLGYLYPVKGIESLLRAFQLVVEKRKNVSGLHRR